jgi:methylenetetrahydrofolate reductase (NADPH)
MQNHPAHSSGLPDSARVPEALRADPAVSIADLLSAGGPTFSFEFFPPKTPAGIDLLAATLDQLDVLAPDFVSVTYGANGSARDKTLEATNRITVSSTVDDAPRRVMGHLTATGQTRDQLNAVLDAYAQLGVRHILAVRGDMPGGPTVPWQPTPGGVANATELVELIAAHGGFTIGVGAFPDIHPAGGRELDVQLLLAKQQAGASFAITQLFFTPQRYFDLVERFRAAGGTMPIIPGLMPVTKLSQVQTFAELSGAPLPTRFVDRLEAVATDAVQVRDVGAQLGYELAVELLRGGAPGVHFFTQNRSGVTREILATLLANPGRWSPAAGSAGSD